MRIKTSTRDKGLTQETKFITIDLKKFFYLGILLGGQISRINIEYLKPLALKGRRESNLGKILRDLLSRFFHELSSVARAALRLLGLYPKLRVNAWAT